MTQIGPETAYELIRRLVSQATDLEADIMVTVCPMCQMNLDAYQGEANRFFGTKYHMPIVFFTQLMAVAFGIEPKQAGFGLELVSAKDALARIGVESASIGCARQAQETGRPAYAPQPPKESKPSGRKSASRRPI